MPKQTFPTEVPIKDFGITSDQLEAKYGVEHPVYTREEWRDEVGNRDTILGYWDWVLHQVESRYSDDCDLCGKRDCEKTLESSEFICQECVEHQTN